MILGTAGFTAAQCVRDILKFVQPNDGPVAVSGATGGVGCLAVMLLAKLGFEVVASTGKANAAPWLMQWGASAVVDRSALADDGRKPLLSTRWAAAVDTVGGTTLVNLLKSTRVNGAVTSCGLVAGNQLEMTVFPFILRGVKLLGITSALCPMPDRVQIWQNLAGPWRLDGLEEICQEISLDQVSSQIQKILAGGVQGRTLIRIAR
ncbi:MAG: zinc-binding dehydrogenase [Pirellulaceae bacterium]